MNQSSPNTSASLLILTVGTGTAGPQSNLVVGLRNTIEMLKPRKFWLIPSASEDSQLVAECVAENFSNFSPLETDASARFRLIPQPDDLESCRQTLREAIVHARAELQHNETLIINPTSGTKQMSVGATLAALDENIGKIIFTVGDRANGVVITGTERIATFDASAYFRERDYSSASELFEAGAFFAAAKILKHHESYYPQAHALALTYHHWQMLNYSEAANAAATHCKDLQRELDKRRSAGSSTPSKLILGDLIAWAGHALKTDDAESLLRLSYKALEYAARCALYEYKLRPDENGYYDPNDFIALKLDDKIVSDFHKKANPKVALGLADICKILENIGDAFGLAYAKDQELKKLLKIRNEIVHAIRPAPMDKAQSLFDRVKNLLKETLQGVPTSNISGSLP
jgi:hypothetical protein